MIRRAERGAALLIALGGLALIGALSAAALTLTTGPATRAAAAIERAKAERAAEAAIHRLAAAFTRPDERARAPSDGVPVVTSFEGAELTLSIQDAVGLIDLNLADAPTLARLGISVGMPEDLAEEFAEALIEARNQTGRRGFATIEDARAASAPAASEFVDALLTHSTVDSGAPGVDPSTATAPALAAAANLPIDVAQAYVARRAIEGRRAPLPPQADLAALRRSDGRVARISVRIATEAGGRAALTVVMRRTDNPRAPVRFLSWR